MSFCVLRSKIAESSAIVQRKTVPASARLTACIYSLDAATARSMTRVVV